MEGSIYQGEHIHQGKHILEDYYWTRVHCTIFPLTKVFPLGFIGKVFNEAVEVHPMPLYNSLNNCVSILRILPPHGFS